MTPKRIAGIRLGYFFYGKAALPGLTRLQNTPPGRNLAANHMGGGIMRAAWKAHFLVMAVLTGLFSLRVAGQAVQFLMPLPFLPDFDSFQGGSLRYSTLLVIQLLILGLMVRTCWRVARGITVPDRRLGRGLAWFGGIYMAGSLARLVVGIAVPSAPAWFSAWIPAFFHLVLAGFALTAAHFHLRLSRTPEPAA